MRISDWSSDVCSSDLLRVPLFSGFATQSRVRQAIHTRDSVRDQAEQERRAITRQARNALRDLLSGISEIEARRKALVSARRALDATEADRSEEHTSELQSLKRISHAVLCLYNKHTSIHN